MSVIIKYFIGIRRDLLDWEGRFSGKDMNVLELQGCLLSLSYMAVAVTSFLKNEDSCSFGHLTVE